MEYIPCCTAPAEHWGLLPATRLASRKNIKRQTGPALCVFSLLGSQCLGYTAKETDSGPRITPRTDSGGGLSKYPTSSAILPWKIAPAQILEDNCYIQPDGAVDKCEMLKVLSSEF
jgi:hypothetical protein